jgi:glyoxylase-like metal-dependent hydrolase (beta-lactamase superfamily II)
MEACVGAHHLSRRLHSLGHDARLMPAKYVKPYRKGQTTAFVTIPITVYVVKLNGKLVLCDAGGGDQVQAFNPNSVFVSGKMMTNMKAAGIDPKRIETILISHFHPDHIFGLLGKNTNAPMFPNAEIIVPAAEYKWWTDSSLINRLPEGRKPLARRIQTVIPN